MNRRVAALAIVSILAALLLSGCSTSYFFSFREEGDLGNDEGDWFMEDWFMSISSASPAVGGSYSFADEGLSLRGKSITCPFMFSGDFTYIVRFWVYADDAHELFFGIDMADGTLRGSASDYLCLEGASVGGDNEVHVYYDASGPHMVMPIDELMPGLNRNGRNVFQLKKKGDNIRIEMNSALVGQFELDDYSSEWFAPCLEAQLDFPYDGDFGVFFESVKVIYEEGMIVETPIII